MGLLATKLCDGKEKMSKIVILGLDGAGKTTVLYRLKRSNVGPTTPTVGFNVETVAVSEGVTFSLWDVGGQRQLRALWRHYYGGVEGLIYVVDSSDLQRIAEASDELFRIVDSPDLPASCPVVVIANKIDKPNALTRTEIIDAMNLTSMRNRKWHIQSACATKGVGIYEAVTELGRLVSDCKRQKK